MDSFWEEFIGRNITFDMFLISKILLKNMFKNYK